MKQTRAPKLTIIHWTDAAGDRYDAELTPPNVCTAGWIVADEPEFYRSACEIFEDGSYDEIIVIPKAIVKTVMAVPRRLPEEFAGWRATGPHDIRIKRY